MSDTTPASTDEPRRLSRGAVLVSGLGAAGAAAGIAAVRADHAEAADRPFSPGFAEVTYGRLRRVKSDRELELKTADKVQTITFEPDSLFWREGPSSLDAFSPGEDVLVEGHSTQNGFVGYALINLLRPLDAHVVGRIGKKLQTDHGSASLVGWTRYAHNGFVSLVPDRLVEVGKDVLALGRRESDGGFVALRFYDPEDGAHP